MKSVGDILSKNILLPRDADTPELEKAAVEMLPEP